MKTSLAGPWSERDAAFAGPVEWTTVKKFSRAIDATIARSRLAADGIDAFLPDEHVVSVNPLLLDAMGGVRLQVRVTDEARARVLLEEAPEADDHDEVPDDCQRCPKCDSVYVRFGWSSRQVLFAILFAGLPLALLEKHWRCERCEHVWEPEPLSSATLARCHDKHHGPFRTRAKKRGTEPLVVFRLRRAQAGLGLFLGAFIGAIALAFADRFTGLVLAAAAPLGGWLLGRGLARHVCSEPSCRALLKARERECPGCKSTIEGEIDSASEHYAALHAKRLEAKRS